MRKRPARYSKYAPLVVIPKSGRILSVLACVKLPRSKFNAENEIAARGGLWVKFMAGTQNTITHPKA